MKVQCTSDLFTPFSGLYDIYVKIMAKAGITVQPGTMIRAQSIIFSEDLAIELYKTIVIDTMREGGFLFKFAAAASEELSKRLERTVKEKVAEVLNSYGPHVDVTLPMGTIIILDDVLPEFGSIQEPQQALEEYLDAINLPNEKVSILN